MRDMQLIYASRPFGYDDLTLTSIQTQARENNARNSIKAPYLPRRCVSANPQGSTQYRNVHLLTYLRDERHVDVVNLL